MHDINIKEMIYNLYKQDWIDTHTTPEMRLQSYRDFYSYAQECLSFGEEPDCYDDWLFDNGIPRGGFYVCYAEFCGAEYRDPEYVRYLLGNDDAFMKLYYEDIGKAPPAKRLDAVLTDAKSRADNPENRQTKEMER